MTRILNTISSILLAAALLAMLGGCARDRQPIYADSEEIDPIEAPPGLDQPQFRMTYEVPGYFLPELAGQSSARPPHVQPSAVAERSRSHIRFGAKGLFLAVEDEPESVWDRLAATLDRDGMEVREIDESQRRYRFHFDHDAPELGRTGLARLAFWRRGDTVDYSGDYHIEVRDGEGETAELILLDPDGEILEMERAETVLARLRDELG
ncbi:outer membrane protein assembly factor BamC [Wenzhouxiangella sp. AB-CW3]|uniref:outer membrane protein assembly factor BamC n=1 Tax=Wenzhouxiangella sp. AB-CW3 TaxID=2771012 RepID=UPI00168BDCA9|nr:outer membrane protein assembly factor BamC [Wenzhouxiangella sp. AB-CW3]QOC23276.1 outer membrane protein assembly factor BamC [Wenzhouxiangella sp. AB-CW3]